MTGSVLATPEAREKIEHLQEKHGQLAFNQLGGGAEEGALKCVTRAELLPQDGDVKLGTVDGAPVFADGDLYVSRDRRRGGPTLVIDVASGSAKGFSLEHEEVFHFVSRAPNGTGEAPSCEAQGRRRKARL